MPTLDDVYRKFGEVSEAAQLLETELGSERMFHALGEKGLFPPTSVADRKAVADLISGIDSQTLGQLINSHTGDLGELKPLLSTALDERNRLVHSFYRQHAFRKFSDDGRAIMMQDLEAIHNALLKAYKALLLLSGIDVDALAEEAAKARERLGLERSPTRSK